MARMVRFEATGPYRIDPQDKPVFICMCGLTRNAPFCDGTHKACKSEKEGAVYVYDKETGEILEEQAEG